MDMKKIAFIEDDTADGGLGMVFRSLATFFSDKADVYYVSTRLRANRIPDTIHYCQFHERKEFRPHTNCIRRSLSGVGPLREELKRINPDVAISFGFYSNIRLCLASIGMKNKVLISERGNATRFHGIYKLFISILFARSNCIVFQSVAAMRAYPRLLMRKGVVIFNAIFRENLPNSANEKWDKRIVSVGRIHPDKNFALLLNAFSIVSQEFPEYCLEIYGEEEPGSRGAYFQRLQDLANQLGIKDKVRFMGQSSNIGEAIFGARLFVLSSVLEGMPNALIEAMACGLPCITTDFLPGCANEIVTDGKDGCIVANQNAKALAEKIRMVLSDCDWSRNMAREAIGIRERLSKEKIFQQWYDLISHLISNRRE